MIRSGRFSVILLMAVGLLPLRPQDTRPAHEIFDHALRLADIYNWDDAGKEFAEAEKLFLATGDQRNALYAKLTQSQYDASVCVDGQQAIDLLNKEKFDLMLLD